jgi:hypothetical protein
VTIPLGARRRVRTPAMAAADRMLQCKQQL